jgi:hypothetical protein
LEERKVSISSELIKLGEQMSSHQQKIKAREAEKRRLYSHSSDEEAKLNDALGTFLSEKKVRLL